VYRSDPDGGPDANDGGRGGTGGTRMKIAFVVHDYHRAGGHSRYVVELAERFSRNNDVHVFANTFVPDGTGSIQFHHVPAWRLTALTTILTFMPQTRGIGRGFDIVHTQGLCSLHSDVITTHICNRAWFNARKRIENKLAVKDYIFDAAVSPLEKWLYSDPVPRVIAVSEKVRQDLADCYGRTANVDVVHHGIDVTQFTPSNKDAWREPVRSEFGLAGSDFVFLFVGDLRKGAAVAIEALSRLPAGKLLLVSRTPAEPYARIAQGFGVGDRVVFAPATQHVERFFAAGDAFVFPTPYDAFGMVISEAMASGLPVITSREAGAAEWLNSADGILLDDPADPVELARHMRRLADDPQLCRTLGEAARGVAERHGWDSVAEATMQVYETVLTGRNK
jgi:UDP-glucose:(heptosyl)LPS alpha-1,3-glucosyltransferase